ncbi:hypothetical protein LTR08_005931 [Meristemomyces frigidus]|nr:hypothetical protein LTR08_005931 [Meristemomyces frigidus]
MPEIGEVAHTVHNLLTHLLRRTITKCTATPDDIVYGKAGTTAEAFAAAVQGRRVTGAAQQGKYFYLTFDRPPHAVMHLGMTGWVVFRGVANRYYKQGLEKGDESGGEEGEEAKKVEEWPPKYAKFVLKSEKEAVDGEDRDEVEAAFIDPRRLARIRLVDCPAEDIRQHSPLKENGPDPVRDKDIVTLDWLTALLARKRVPVKALLLNQANLSGIGNWVADEILYQAHLHPEQYSNTFAPAQILALHTALLGVCAIAVETLADSRQFPETWLMKHRWGKGKKGGNVLPSGEEIVHITVGGRTSAIVPSVQKKTGEVEVGEGGARRGGRKRKVVAKQEDSDEEEDKEEEEEEEKPAVKKPRGGKKATAEPKPKPVARKSRAGKKTKAEPEDSEPEEPEDEDEDDVKPAAAKKLSGRGKKTTTKRVKADEVNHDEADEAVAGAEAEVDGPAEPAAEESIPAAKSRKVATPRKSKEVKPVLPGERTSGRTAKAT